MLFLSGDDNFRFRRGNPSFAKQTVGCPWAYFIQPKLHVISVSGRIYQLKALSERGLPTTSGGGECVNGISVGGRNLANSVGADSISARNVRL